DLPGAGISDRAICRSAATSPHAAAPAAVDGGTAIAVAGGPAVPAAPWPAGTRPHLLGRPAPPLAAGAGTVPTPNPPRHRFAAVRRDLLALAHAGPVRPRPALRRLALRAARLFPRHRPAVLVSRGPPLSKPAALVALAAIPLPDRRGRAEHGPV